MRKVVISGIIGNGLEWYDFALYGQFAAIIGKHFFPSTDLIVSLIATFGVFAAGFLMRPVGAIVFGYIGDRYGRRKSLAISILMMAIPTAMIGLLPTYAQIGILAPILLTVIRLLQGLSLGGEFSGCISFIGEHSKDHHRGLVGSYSMFSMCAGILLGSAVGTFVGNVLSEEDFLSWGWRIPFVIGIVIGLVGLYIRSHVDESPHFVKAKGNNGLSEKPLRETLTKYTKNFVIGIGIYLTVTVPFYSLVVFMKTFMTKILGHPESETFFINTVAMFVLTIFIPLSGHLSDKVGRKKILVISTVTMLFATYPIFILLCQPEAMARLIAQSSFAFLCAMFIGPVAATLVELFPTRVRFTGVALSYNLSATIFGGTTPIVATWLIDKTGLNYSLAFYIMFFNILTLISLYFYKDKYNKPLT